MDKETKSDPVIMAYRGEIRRMIEALKDETLSPVQREKIAAHAQYILQVLEND